MSELTGGDTAIPQDGKDAVFASRTTVPLGPASAGLSKTGIAAMQGVDLPEPIKSKEWNTRPDPAPEQVEPEIITQAELDAPAKKLDLYTDPTVENPEEIFANPDPSAPPSEGPVESSVRRRG